MERIGERLRRKREELGLTLEDVSGSIRYRPEIITAIEEGRTGVFPAKAYLSAFLRAYAAVLDLDPREIVREQKSEEERAFEAIRTIRMKPKRRRRVPRKALYIAIPIALAIILLIVVDRSLWDRERDVPGESAERAVTVVPVGMPAAEDTAGSERGPASAGETDDAAGETDDAGQTPASSGEALEQDRPDEGAGAEGAGAGLSADGVEPEATAETSREIPLEEALVPLADSAEAGKSPESGAETGATAGEQQASRADAGQVSEAPAEAGGAAQPPAEVQTEPEAEAEPRTHKLVVSARRGAYISLSTGGRSLLDGYFSGGEVDSFFSATPFVIRAITDRGAWTFVQDGERVRLPGSTSEDVSNFEIPLPSGDRR